VPDFLIFSAWQRWRAPAGLALVSGDINKTGKNDFSQNAILAGIMSPRPRQGGERTRRIFQGGTTRRKSATDQQRATTSQAQHAGRATAAPGGSSGTAGLRGSAQGEACKICTVCPELAQAGSA